MSKFLDELQAKALAFGELTHATDAVSTAKELLQGLSKGLLLRSSKKELKTFYSDKNFIAIKQMVIDDRAFLAKTPTSNPSAKFKELNFFQLYLELKTQEELKAAYPEKIFTNMLQLEKYTELLSNVKALLSEVQNYATRNGIINVFNAELNKKKAEVDNFRKLFKLIK